MDVVERVSYNATVTSNYHPGLAAALSRPAPGFWWQRWLRAQQLRLGEIVGEPLFITIRLVYDGTVEANVQTFTGREGMGDGETVLAAMEAAVETLLYLDKFVRT